MPPDPHMVRCTGNERGVCRINIDGVNLPSKLTSDYKLFSVNLDSSQIFRNSDSISYAIEILVNKGNTILEWVSGESAFINGEPVEDIVIGGVKPDGGPLYVAQHDGHCGYFDL